MANAYANHSPVLLLAGYLFGGEGALGSGALHEIADQGAAIAGIIGQSTRVRSAGEIGTALDVAFDRLLGFPVKPAAIEIGPDVLLAETDLPVPAAGPRPEPPPVDADAIEQAAAALAGASRPMILAGGGARLASDGLQALAAALGAPVVVTPEGKGAVPGHLPEALPHAAGYSLLDEVDALVVVGSRFNSNTGPIQIDPGAALVRIDADPARLPGARTEGGELVCIQADAAPATIDLAAAVAKVRPADPVRDELHRARVAEARTAVLRGLAGEYPETWAFCQALRDAIPDDGVLVDEMTQVGYMARNAFPVPGPHHYIGPGYQGTLGFGYATALGAKVGRPDRAVVSVSGDGGFLYTATELATAVHHRIAVVAVVFTDDAYGNVKGIQQRVYGREIASSLTNPDFAKLAESFGVRGSRAGDAGELRQQVAAAIERDEPAVIEVPIGPQPDMFAILGGRRRL
jgi:acetolactate synthase-1/2/3 large subunit